MTYARSICCSICGLQKEGNRGKFSTDKQNRDGLMCRCKICQTKYMEEYNNKPENIRRKREQQYIKRYGLTLEDYDQLLDSQDGQCAICKTENPGKRRFHVDHCHLTDEIRGLLCSNCNLMLGLNKDNVQTLRNAIKYLEER